MSFSSLPSFGDKAFLSIKYELKDFRMNSEFYDVFGVAGLPITNRVGGGLNSMSVFSCVCTGCGIKTTHKKT